MPWQVTAVLSILCAATLLVVFLILYWREQEWRAWLLGVHKECEPAPPAGCFIPPLIGIVFIVTPIAVHYVEQEGEYSVKGVSATTTVVHHTTVVNGWPIGLDVDAVLAAGRLLETSHRCVAVPIQESATFALVLDTSRDRGTDGLTFEIQRSGAAETTHKAPYYSGPGYLLFAHDLTSDDRVTLNEGEEKAACAMVEQ